VFPEGYANFNYYCTIGRLSSPRTTKVACGTCNVELALEEELSTRRLELPDGNLTTNKEKSEISIHRSLALPEKGLSVGYDRIYPSQYGFDEMMRRMGRALKKAYIYEPDETFVALSDVLKNYLVRNLGFTETATFSHDNSSEAWIQGRAKFTPNPGGDVPKEHAECSISLSDAFIEEISEACQKTNGRILSGRRRNMLAKKEEPLGIDTFLRVVGVYQQEAMTKTTGSTQTLENAFRFLGVSLSRIICRFLYNNSSPSILVKKEHRPLSVFYFFSVS